MMEWKCDVPSHWFTLHNLDTNFPNKVGCMVKPICIPQSQRNETSMLVFCGQGVCQSTQREHFNVVYCPKEYAEHIVEANGCKHNCEECEAAKRQQAHNEILHTLFDKQEENKDLVPCLIIAVEQSFGVHAQISEKEENE